jgi:hypothetical protein
MPRPVLAARLAATTLLALSACGGGGDAAPAVSQVAILTPSPEVAVGELGPLAAVVLPDPGVEQAVGWTSSDTGVARVALSGGRWQVRGVASGTATLTAASAQDPSRQATTTVTVYRRATLAWTTESALFTAPGPFSAAITLTNTGERDATGVDVAVDHVLGAGGWLAAAPAGAAPRTIPPGGHLQVDLAVDEAGLGLAAGLHAAEVLAAADPGVLVSARPFTVLLAVP